MLLRRRGPFLREAEKPVAALLSQHGRQVLEDAGVLVERLFDEERVVRDLEGGRRDRGGRLRQRGHRAQHTDQQDRRDDLDEQLRRGARADRELVAAFALHPHAVGRLVARLDPELLSGLEAARFQEPQERRVLIGHPRDGQRHADRTRQQVLHLAVGDDALGIRDRVAVRVHFRVAEHLVHAFDEPLRDDVLELLRLVVHFVPAHPHHLHQEQLDEPVPPDDQPRQPFPRRREPNSGIRFVVHQPRLRQRLDHRRRAAGGDPDGRGEGAHLDERAARRQGQLLQVDVLEVVLDGAGWKHGSDGSGLKNPILTFWLSP